MFQRRRTAAQWTSENPTLSDGEFGFERDTGLLKIGNGVTAWTSLAYLNDIAELVADEPTEVDLDTVGDTTTLSLFDTIARNALKHASGQYYANSITSISAQLLTLQQLVLSPCWLSAGTIDRLGVDVSTAAATGIIRVGIYTDSGGLPNALVAEGTSGADTYPLDASSTGAKTAAISAVIPHNGRYWLALVNQTAAVSINAPGNYGNNPIPLPLGTSPITGTTSYFSRVVASVSGALPSTITGLNANPQGVRARWIFRYA
jgi:hypothetical protein